MPLKDRFLTREFLAGIVFALFGAAMLVSYNPRFGVYPKAIFTLMVAFGAVSAAASLLPGGKRTPVEKVSRYELCFILALVLSPALVTSLGFYAGSFLVIYAIALLACPRRDARSVLRTGLYVLAVVAVTYAVFTGILNIQVPSGLLI